MVKKNNVFIKNNYKHLFKRFDMGPKKALNCFLVTPYQESERANSIFPEPKLNIKENSAKWNHLRPKGRSLHSCFHE